MEWTEAQEMAAARARLQNRVNNGLLQIALYGVAFGFLPAVGIPVASLIHHTNIKWVPFLIFVAGCGLLGTLVGLVRVIRGWNYPRKRSVVLDDHSLTLSDKSDKTTVAYNDLVGFSIFELSCGKLLVFGQRKNNNLSIGISPEISTEDMRTFLIGKLSELANDEIPDHRK